MLELPCHICVFLLLLRYFKSVCLQLLHGSLLLNQVCVELAHFVSLLVQVSLIRMQSIFPVLQLILNTGDLAVLSFELIKHLSELNSIGLDLLCHFSSLFGQLLLGWGYLLTQALIIVSQLLLLCIKRRNEVLTLFIVGWEPFIQSLNVNLLSFDNHQVLLAETVLFLRGGAENIVEFLLQLSGLLSKLCNCVVSHRNLRPLLCYFTLL